MVPKVLMVPKALKALKAHWVHKAHWSRRHYNKILNRVGIAMRDLPLYSRPSLLIH